MVRSPGIPRLPRALDEVAGQDRIDADSSHSPGWLRRLIHPFVPAGFHDPVGLARRLLSNPDPGARFALRAAATAPFLTPFDFLLAPFEGRLYRQADELAFGEAPMLFLFFYNELYAVQPWIAGFKVPTIFTGQDWSDVEIRQDVR